MIPRPTSSASRGEPVHRRPPWALLLSALLLAGCLAAPATDTTAVSTRDPRLQRGVERAIHWLTQAVEEQWRPDMAAMAQYLQRKFRHPGLARFADGARTRFQRAATGSDEFPPPFFRLIDPDAVVDGAAIAAIPNRIGRITAAALHCDEIALPAAYLGELEQLAQRGGYSLTHALIAAQWLEENHCCTGADLKPLRSAAIARVVALVEAPKIPNDLRIEAIATLYYVGARDRIRQAWIDALLSNQREDGGWALTVDRQESHPHPTFLALWVLLETLYPEAPALPMIPESPRQPGRG